MMRWKACGIGNRNSARKFYTFPVSNLSFLV
jgi:hypothetical protein